MSLGSKVNFFFWETENREEKNPVFSTQPRAGDDTPMAAIV